MSPPGEGGPCLPRHGSPDDSTAASREAMPSVAPDCGWCPHRAASHWEVAEPGGPRAGCGVVGCTCTGYRPWRSGS